MNGERVGTWVVGEPLGEGTQGTVYTARHSELGRDAAIKILRPNLARNRDRIDRFFDEARAASSIRHPGVVEVFDCGRERGIAYIAMERLVGETLHARVRRAPVSLGEAITIVRQVAEALTAAHDLGVVHRDLKPENIFLAERGGAIVVKLVDFGIAKLAPDQRSTATLTGAGLLGSPPYMSPEQCAGAPVDHRADLYALGCLLHELVTGTPPFGFDDTAELVAAHRDVAPPSLSDGCPGVPAALDDLAARLLQKDPVQRPGSARDVVTILDGLALAATIELTRIDEEQSLAATVVEPARGRRARMWRALLETPPWVAAGICCVAGAVLLGVAIIDRVGDSYGASNWGFTYIVLVPLIASFLLKTMASGDAALRELGGRGMLRMRNGSEARAVVAASSLRLGAGIVAFGVIVAALSIAVSIGEWHHRWQNAAIPGTWWSESIVTGVVGAVFQGLLITIVLVFVVYCIGWSHLLHQLTTPRSPVRLAIDRTSTDPRRGFEALEQPVVLSLVTGVLVQTALYFSNVQHFAEIRGEALFATIVPRTLEDLLDVGSGRYPSTTTLLASVLVMSFLATAGYLMNRAVQGAEDGPGGWPLAIRPTWSAALLVIVAGATLWYRLAPVVLGMVLLLAWQQRPRRASAS